MKNPLQKNLMKNNPAAEAESAAAVNTAPQLLSLPNLPVAQTADQLAAKSQPAAKPEIADNSTADKPDKLKQRKKVRRTTKQHKKQNKKKLEFSGKNFFSGIGVLALAGVSAAALYFLPPSSQAHDTNSAPGFTTVHATGGKMHLICTGNALPLVQAGASAAQAAQATAATSTPAADNAASSARGFIFPADGLALPAEKTTEKTTEAEQLTGITWRESAVANTPAPANSTAAETRTTSEIPINTHRFGLAPSTAAPAPTDFTALSATPTTQMQGIIALARAQKNSSTLAASNLHQAQTGDLRGIAHNPCAWETNSAWFVGLKAGVGISNQLRIVNPSAHSILVQLTAFNSLGKAQVGANAHLTVAPGQMKTLSLDGIISADEQIALHLHSATGFFGATVQTTALTGITPQGVDFLKPAAIGTDLVIPGLYLPPAKSVVANDGKPLVDLGDANPPATSNSDSAQAAAPKFSELVVQDFHANLRLVNPSTATRNVSVYTVREGESPQLLAGAENIALAPQTVFDLSLAGLRSGGYSLQIVADGEITAAAQVVSGAATQTTDYAWLPAQNLLRAGGAAIAAEQGQLVFTALHNLTQKSASAVNNGLAGNTEPDAQTVTGKWAAYDAAGKLLSENDFSLNLQGLQGSNALNTQLFAATQRIVLPAQTAFVNFQASAPIAAAIAIADRAADTNGQLVDWVPFTPKITDVAQIALNIQN